MRAAALVVRDDGREWLNRLGRKPGIVREPDPERALAPQAGPQEEFLASSADIAIGGGGAGGGKTWSLLLEPLRHINKVPGFGAVIFRRTYAQIKNTGSLLDESYKLYPRLGATFNIAEMTWTFPPFENTVQFAHMQHEQNRFNWDGAQIALIGFDQAEHFSWAQVSYMMSRNRSDCGVVPYIRATCNPDPDSWLRDFLRWWIDDETGIAIPERSGVVRWFVNVEDNAEWADTREELLDRFGPDAMPKSCTFVPSSVYDNKIQLKQNPEYLANLKALQKVERERLLGCNWNARARAGSFFKREYFEIVSAAPPLVDEVRYWDRAGTEEADATSGSSYTAGCRLGVDARGVFYMRDVNRFRAGPLAVETAIKNTASQDTKNVRVGIEQDPGQAGKAEAMYHVRNLAGYSVSANAVHESKGLRATPASAQAEAGNVKLVRGAWNEPFLREAENFDGSARRSDQIDAFSGAMHMLTSVVRGGTWGR